MIIFHPPQADARTYEIGKIKFNVNAYFCGYESIYDRLACLMQSELEDSRDIISENGEDAVDFEQD